MVQLIFRSKTMLVAVALSLSACSGNILNPDQVAPRATEPLLAEQPEPSATPAPRGPVDYRQQADEAYAAGNMESAVSNYTEVIKFLPKDADTHYRRGLAQHRKGDYKSAVSDYTVSLMFNNERAEVYCDRGLAREQNGNHAEAAGDFLACKMMARDETTKTRATKYLLERGMVTP